MAFFNWDESLDVGVEDMNAEHRDILDLMNELYEAAHEGVHGAPVNDLVARLGQVCIDHFADEERFMDSIRYPQAATHKMLHKSLLERYQAGAATIKANGGVVDDEFLNFLKFWLNSHIKGVDVKYGAHARSVPAR